MTLPKTSSFVQAKPLYLRTTAPDFDALLTQRLAWEASTDHQIEQAVSTIVAQVQVRGDEPVHSSSPRRWRASSTRK